MKLNYINLTQLEYKSLVGNRETNEKCQNFHINKWEGATITRSCKNVRLSINECKWSVKGPCIKLFPYFLRQEIFLHTASLNPIVLPLLLCRSFFVCLRGRNIIDCMELIKISQRFGREKIKLPFPPCSLPLSCINAQN